MDQAPKKRYLIGGLVILIVLAGVGGWFLLRKAPSEEGEGERVEQLGDGISAEFFDSSYKIADGKTLGFFKTGQEADILLSGIDFNNTGGPLLFNHPGGIASDGTHLLLADRNNNRVLIWSKLPTDNTAPDLVLGQKNFTTNNPGTGLGQMNWPVAVATDGTHVVVGDTENDRLLIWNSFPTKSGGAADLEIKDIGGGPGPKTNPKRQVGWPWAVWTNGEKLIVTSTATSSVLIWNSFPTKNNQAADLVLYAKGNFGTPRSIGSDGKHLVIGDHNAKPNNNQPGTFFWKNFPTRDDQPYDFFIAAPGRTGEERPGSAQGEVLWGPTVTSDGKLFALSNEGLFIWNSFPKDGKDAADLFVGSSSAAEEGYRFEDGDGSGIAFAGGKLYLSLSNGNKIVGFNSLPTTANQKPDFAVGAPDIDTDTLQTNFIMSNPVPVSNGKNLFVSSDFDSKLYVWKNLPDESGAHPDLVYSLPEGPWDNALYGDTLALAGRAVYIWKSLPTEGQGPDLIFDKGIGGVGSGGFKGVALDEKYFYLADENAGKVYVWEGIPGEESNPKFTLSVDQPTRLSSDGEYLVVTCTLGGPGGSVRIYSVADLSNNAKPLRILQGMFNLPQGATAFQGHLFVGDTGFHRVLIWRNIADAVAGKLADVVLGASKLPADMRPGDTQPQIGKDKLFWPAVPYFDGSYLWVGEFKFSERLLRFSPSP